MAENVSAILYFQCSTTSPLDAASPSTRLWFTTCHRRGRQSNCFTLILRSRGSYRGRVSAHTRRPRKSIVVSSALIYARPGRFRPFRFALWPLTRFTWTSHDTSVVGPISRPLSASFCSPLPLFERRGDFHTREFYALRLFLGPTSLSTWPGEPLDFPSVEPSDTRLNLPSRFFFLFFFSFCPRGQWWYFLKRPCALKCKFQKGSEKMAQSTDSFDVTSSGGGVMRRLLHAN